MTTSWALQDAKAHFSEVVKNAKVKPQFITVRGEPAVVILSEKIYQSLVAPKKSLVDFFRKSPLMGLNLNLTRDKSHNREIDL